MRLPKYSIHATETKKLKSGTIMTVNITRIGTQPRAKGQMLTLSELRRVS